MNALNVLRKSSDYSFDCVDGAILKYLGSDRSAQRISDPSMSNLQLTQILARLSEQEDCTSRIEVENQKVNEENVRLKEEIRELWAQKDKVPRARLRSPNER